MAASESSSTKPLNKKRSHKGRSAEGAKRLKASSGHSELSLRGGSGRPGRRPNTYKRGVVRPPTEHEWEALMATGVMTGVDDLRSSRPDPGLPTLGNTEGDRGNGHDSTYRGSKVEPIPIHLPSSTPTKSTPAKSAQPSTDRPSKAASTTKPARPPSSTTKAVLKAASRQSTSTRATQATPARATPKQVHLSSDDFDASTPFPSGIDQSSYLGNANTTGHTYRADYLEYAYGVSNPMSYEKWRDMQDRLEDTQLLVRPRDTSDASTSPTVADEGAGSRNGSSPPTRRWEPPASSTSSPGRPSLNFTDDNEILQKWTALEIMIEQYVEECIAEAMPDDIDTIENSPYEVFRYLAGDDAAYMMCRNPVYSPYLFQMSIWNYLLSTLFARGSSTWAVDVNNSTKPPTLGQGSGLGLATDYATAEVMFRGDQGRTYENRMKFFIFRKEAADYIYEYLVNDQHYATQFNEICQELMYLFTGYFKPEYARGTADAWTELLRLTTDVVSAAWNLAILMRRSDGVWDAFMLEPESSPYEGCVQLHQRTELAAPQGQGSILPGSKITMCVVPGLVKHEVVPDSSRGPDGSRVRTMRRVCAKVFVDFEGDGSIIW